MTDITDYKEKHVFSSDEKLSMWGYGEWVEEPDFVEFSYKGALCRLERIAVQEPNPRLVFGGYFCGYARVPIDHPWYQANFGDIDADVHGGLSFYGEKEGAYWIGFDCAHCGDVTPSMRALKEQVREQTRQDIERITGKTLSRESPIFHDVYRNIAYVKAECMKLVDQLLDAAKVNEERK